MAALLEAVDFLFYHLAQQRQRSCTLTSLQKRSQENTLVDLSSQQGQVLGARYWQVISPLSPRRVLYTVQKFSAAAQTSDLASLYSQMSAELTTVCDAPTTLQELSQALGKLPRGKQPGSDGRQ